MIASYPEDELLCYSISPMHDAATVDRIRELLAGPCDWEKLLERAYAQRVAPLLYANLMGLAPDALPERYRLSLQHHFEFTAQRNMVLTGELLNLLHHFAAADICAVPYKGPLLAMATYGNLALREFSDLDILIDRQDAEQAGTILHDRGYRAHSHPDYAVQYVRNEGQFVVELHWQAVGFAEEWQTVARHVAFPLDLPFVRDRLQLERRVGANIWSLAPEDMLLVLCVHGSRHRWERLAWICDVAYHLQRFPVLDWLQIISQARLLGVERMLYLGLWLSYIVLGIKLPEDLLKRIRSDMIVQHLTLQLCRRLFDEAQPTYGYERLTELGFTFRMRERMQDRVILALHYLYISLHSTYSNSFGSIGSTAESCR
jgi:hypothetical protein